MKNKFVSDFLKAINRRRWFTRIVISVIKVMRHRDRIKLPRKMSEAEKIGVSLFIRLLRDSESKMYYDIKSQECYIKSSDSTVYIFLESLNLKVINTVVGYDIHLQAETENYLSFKFIDELNKRRLAFKKEAMEKVDHSLQKTFDRFIQKNEEHFIENAQ